MKTKVERCKHEFEYAFDQTFVRKRCRLCEHTDAFAFLCMCVDYPNVLNIFAEVLYRTAETGDSIKTEELLTKVCKELGLND